MMQDAGYERFGLISNPFQDLDSESVHGIEMFHVDQEFDRYLQHVKQEVLDAKAKTNVAIVGDLGVGKTQRLLVAASQARRLEAYTVFHQTTTDLQWIVRDLAETFRKNARVSSITRAVSPPGWYKNLAKIPRRAKKRYDPEWIGKTLAQALNANAPAFLLLNDLHAVEHAEDAEEFLQTLLALVTNTDPGVLVMVGSYPGFWSKVEAEHPALVSRFHRIHHITPLTVREGELIVAKRLSGKRIVEDLDPLYPFSSETVHAMTREAGAMPRRLLQIADKALETAASERSYRIDDGIVSRVIQSIHQEEAGPSSMAPDRNDSPENFVEAAPGRPSRGADLRRRHLQQNPPPLGPEKETLAPPSFSSAHTGSVEGENSGRNIFRHNTTGADALSQ